jgi:hypothetical protein
MEFYVWNFCIHGILGVKFCHFWGFISENFAFTGFCNLQICPISELFAFTGFLYLKISLFMKFFMSEISLFINLSYIWNFLSVHYPNSLLEARECRPRSRWKHTELDNSGRGGRSGHSAIYSWYGRWKWARRLDRRSKIDLLVTIFADFKKFIPILMGMHKFLLNRCYILI